MCVIGTRCGHAWSVGQHTTDWEYYDTGRPVVSMAQIWENGNDGPRTEDGCRTWLRQQWNTAPLHIHGSENTKASRLDVIGQLDTKTNQRDGECPFCVLDPLVGEPV